MHRSSLSVFSLACLMALQLSEPADAAVVDQITTFATGQAVGASGPDSISVGNGYLWAAYTNGADSTGASGSSAVVQYTLAGTVVHQYSFAGYVDGLKVNPANGLVWALQNQDGNSTLSIINPGLGVVAGSPMAYAVPSGGRGYDDVVFRNGQVFMSYTNPTGPSDATIQLLTNGTNPLALTTVLRQGATGVNLATGQGGQTTSQNDPDSLKLTPTGDLMLSSGDDGQLVFVHNPTAASQSVSFLQLTDGTGAAVSGLDDAVFATAARGTFYVADTAHNRILAVQASDLAVGSLFASVGSLNELASVDAATGIASAFVSGSGTIASPHGLEFIAAVPEPGTYGLMLGGLAVMACVARRRMA